MKTTNKSNKVPRPLNSYILFRVQKQREIVEQCPGANHRDISKITSKWWRELSPEEKQVYIDEAERLKQEHKLLYPDYKFTPKKRSRSVRPYKRRPSNELIALNHKDKQNLLALYHHGTIKKPSEMKEELVNQIKPTAPKTKRVRTQNKRSTSFESPMNSTPQFDMSSVINYPINTQLLYPLDDHTYYGLSPSYSSIVSQSPYECQLFEDAHNGYVPNYLLYQEQPGMYHFVPSEPIYPNVSFDDDIFSNMKLENIYDDPATLQPLQLLTRPFPS